MICDCPLLKDSIFNKVFVGMVWLTSNHMFGLGDFWDKSPSWFLEILKLPLFHSSNFKIFTFGQFIPNRPPKHVITSTDWTVIWSNLLRKAETTTTFYFPVEEESMYEKRTGECERHGPQSWCKLFITYAQWFLYGKDCKGNWVGDAMLYGIILGQELLY